MCIYICILLAYWYKSKNTDAYVYIDIDRILLFAFSFLNPYFADILEQASRIRPSFGAAGIRMLSGFYSAARHAMANVHTSSLAVYRLEMLERICKTVAKLRLSEEVEVCDVVIGINLHEEARVAKGFPSLLSFEVRANGRQNLELLDREPLLAYSKLEKRILALCHQYGTLSEDSFSGDDFSTLGEEFDDEGDSRPSFLLAFFSIILYFKSFLWNNLWDCNRRLMS